MVQPRSRLQLGLMVFGVVLLGVLGAGGLWLATREPAVVVVPPAVALVDPPVLIEVDAGVVEEVVDAGVVEEVVDAGVVEEVAVEAPSVKQLKEHFSRIDAKAKKKKPKHEGRRNYAGLAAGYFGMPSRHRKGFDGCSYSSRSAERRPRFDSGAGAASLSR